MDRRARAARAAPAEQAAPPARAEREAPPVRLARQAMRAMKMSPPVAQGELRAKPALADTTLEMPKPAAAEVTTGVTPRLSPIVIRRRCRTKIRA